MQAVIMAGGEGVRLRPLTCDLPKPMVPMLDRPVMEFTVELLERYGFDDIIVALHYLPETIAEYFGEGEDYGVHMSYSLEEVPLGTAGSVRLAMPRISGTFLVASGDALTDIDLAQAVRFHREHGSKATLVLKRVPNPVDYGVVATDEEGRILRFQEKPQWGEVLTDTVNTGIYILEPEVMGQLPDDGPCDFAKDLFPQLLKMGIPMYGYVAQGYWCDIGSSDVYLQAHLDLLEGRLDYRQRLTPARQGLYIHPSAQVHPRAVLHPPLYVGPEAVVEEGAVVGPETCVGTGSILGRGCSVKRSVLWDSVHVEQGAQIRGSVVCSGTVIQRQARLFEGTVIGQGCCIGEETKVKQDVRIWPEKRIERRSWVQQDIMWGACSPASYLGGQGVEGILNQDLDLQCLVQVASTFTALSPEQARIGVAQWGDESAEVVSSALRAALAMAGAQPYDLGSAPLFLSRYAVTALGLEGCIHLRMKQGRIRLTFLNRQGRNLTAQERKKMENLLLRRDIPQVHYSRMGRRWENRRTLDFYAQELERHYGTLLRDAPIGVLCADDKLCALLQEAAALSGNLFRAVSVDPMALTEGQEALRAVMKQAGLRLAAYLPGPLEDFTLVDGEGRQVQEQELDLLHLDILMGRARRREGIPVPAYMPHAMDILAHRHGCSCVPDGANRQEWLERFCEVCQDEPEVVALSQMVQDPIRSLLENWAALRRGQSFHEHLLMLPRCCLIAREVSCPKAYKGTLLRLLHEDKQANEVKDLRGGIQLLREKGRTLISPDSALSSVRIFTEADDMEAAEEISTFYADRIRELIEQKER